MKTHLILSVLGSRPHGDGVFSQVFSHRKRSFSKTLSRVDLFENSVFLFSCGRVKTELFETLTSRHRFTTYQSMCSVLWGSREGIFLVCFLSSKFDCRISLSIMEFRYRISNCECHSVSVWTGIFLKTLLVWTRIFLKTDKKRCVFKNIRIRVDGALIDIAPTGTKIKYFVTAKTNSLHKTRL